MGTWKPSDKDWEQVFIDQNPWHETGSVPPALAPEVERPLVELLTDRLLSDAPERFQVVLGPRRVGKTTAMYQTVKRLLANGVAPRRLWWLRLDHPILLPIPLGALVKEILRVVPKGETIFFFLDEVTYAKDWDIWLKTFYDEKWPVRIVATSSATAALKDRRLESGIGRWEEQYLSPYLFGEYLDLIQESLPFNVEKNLFETIHSAEVEFVDVFQASFEKDRKRFMLTGGFPELLLKYASDTGTDDETIALLSQRTLRSDAVERAIYKDIPQTFDIRDPMLLERLLYTLAGQMTGILSPKTIGSSLDGLSQPTFDKYLSYLIRTFLVFVLPNYAGSEEVRQRRGRKLYFVDGAVRNAALQRGISPFEDPMEQGPLLENLVAGHLHALAQQTDTRLYHWRDGKQEVDLVYDHPSSPLVFEIASSPRHSKRGLEQFVEKFNRFRGSAYLVAPNAPYQDANKAANGIGTLSLDRLLLATSAQAARALQERLAS